MKALLCDRVDSKHHSSSTSRIQYQQKQNLNAFGEDEAMGIFEDWRNSDEGSEANNDLNNNEIMEIQEEENKLNWSLRFYFTRVD